jgi:lipopolysaccharide/colanic/teichoic acid biosynthesis glycosyltransferase
VDERARRIVDVVGATAGLVALAPLLLILWLAVRLDSPGAVLHRATRIGLDGRPFTLYKFRSMDAGAALHGPAITADQDARVTRIGRTLRRAKLDELPQLVNVLRGDMSLVGPRPEDPRYVALYSPEQREVLKARPGITSPASLKYRGEEQLLTGGDWEDLYVRRILPAKLAIDLEYLRRRTVMTDLGVILATVFAHWTPQTEPTSSGS